ncbi:MULTISPECIES: glycosyltransferase [unclassified Vulcanococcus]|jgi:1,2-diacylglycerol 3-beta-glucosyltransferase|uniref:glycosyltransferase n=1 Tax=unclassified Vulcanococcus TaxID=2766969 RepID=UPI0025F629BC|nr:glycosyltransferase [Vulcanococcus sp. CPBay_Sum15L08_68]MDA1156506.1 glycosyltransferase [Cyanobacteriota bacterium]
MAAGGTATGARRLQASLFLLCCCGAAAAPHRLPASQALWPATALTLLLGLYVLRAVFLPALRGAKAEGPAVLEALPAVDLVVAARDEEAVIGRLVERLAALSYPADRLKIWIVDDGSEDRTPEVLSEYQARFPQLQVLRRPRDAGGGKSGALNAVLPNLQGRWLLVLDADAQLQPDLLERLVRFAEQGGWSAVQLRKSVVNPDLNWLTRAQAMEMALDAVIQQGRLFSGGVVELRGNGQLLQREAVLSCEGFNEATVTDDLDLSFRLLVQQQPVALLWDPPVQEEAVTAWSALWRQRQRWAEGGLQRFFDYWPQLTGSEVSAARKLDLSCFFLLQYALPVMAAADALTALITRTPPLSWPLSFVAFGLSGGAILAGCSRRSEGPDLPAMGPINLAWGIAYLGHWFVVIPYTTLRMALLPKRLVWAKTLHVGAEPDQAAA